MSAAIDSLKRLRARRVEVDPFARLASPPLATRLSRLQAEAFATFEAHGIPSHRLERWKGTPLGRLEEMTFDGPASDSAADLVLDGESWLASPRARKEPDSLATSGIRVLTLVEATTAMPAIVEQHLATLADPKSEALVALQTALFDDVAVVHVAEGAAATRPIRLRIPTPRADRRGVHARFPRVLVVAERNARATVVLENEGRATSSGFTALVSECHLAEGAHVELAEIQHAGEGHVHFTSTHARVARNARFDSHVFTLGRGLVRSELAIVLAEPEAQTRMRGFFLGRDESHVDHFTTVDHAAERCTSDEEYRGVLGGASKGVFRGRVIVRPDAQKTDARQSNPNLLLSEDATVDSKPQLEIYADDVKASHGATIGQLDPEALFFLRARGIEERVARLVLTRAFASRVVEDLPGDEELRRDVTNRIEEALGDLEHASAEERAIAHGASEPGGIGS